MKEIDVDTLKKQIDVHVMELNRKPPRNYLGISAIGHQCIRHVFYSWRFALPEIFPARLYRLFSRGHAEEFRFVDYLRGAGYPTLMNDPKTKKQFELVQHHGHIRGHSDGFTYINNEWHVAEYKTASNKSWLKLNRAKSVKVANFQYYAQCQEYMYGFNVNKALFMSVNKDNDLLYIEFIDRDKQVHMEMQERFVELCMTPTIPKRCSQEETYYICTFCNFKGLCFSTDKPVSTCRMCSHVELVKKGGWKCKKYTKNLSLSQQYRGCSKFSCIKG